MLNAAPPFQHSNYKPCTTLWGERGNRLCLAWKYKKSLSFLTKRIYNKATINRDCAPRRRADSVIGGKPHVRFCEGLAS